jgi:hypothetical protein
LLSDTAPGAANNDSRILANLEGRVVAQQAPRKRSKKPLVAAALAVIGVSALGAWQWQRGQRSEPPIAAAAPAAAGKLQPASGGGATALASATTAPVAAAAANTAASSAAADMRVAQAASSPQPAVIVADDSVRADSSIASSSAAADADRLARALTSGAPGQAGAQTANVAASAPAASSVAATSAPAAARAKQTPANKKTASRPERESGKNRNAEKLAAAHASKHEKRRASAVKDDPDADLLAALVARTKPYDPKAAKPASSTAAAKTAQPAAKAQTASLGDQLKACDKGNFFEAQACHWRVCSGHWGKDAACPSAGPASATQGNG